MSLPNTRSSELAIEDDASGREGRLADTSVPELLARAYRVSFSGSLILEPVDAGPSSVRFVGGCVVDVSGPFLTRELEWEVLGCLLPADTLDFAAGHAREYGVEPFFAVERLLLLPEESMAAARQALSVRGIEMLCGLSGDVRYAFALPLELGDLAARRAVRVEPLGLLMSCFLVESQRERAIRSVAGFEHATLSVDPGRARRLLATLHGPARAVLECIVLSPSSVQSLRERKLVADPDLVASVCALWITHEVSVPGAASLRAPSRADSVPPFSPAASSMPPPRKDSGFIRASAAAADRGAQEHAMELKVEEAWMKAEADPSRAHQVSAVVRKAVGVFPRNPRLRYYLARLHVQASRFVEAMEELERVLELDPGDAQVQAELAELRARFPGTSRSS